MTNHQLSREEYLRYSRHIILPEFGIEGQMKLKVAKVLVVGAGGLGVPVLIYLAAAGVGEIGIVDYDSIDYSNLQRQVIYKTREVGESKAQSAKAFILEQNPSVKITVHEEWIDSNNAMKIVEGYDLIVDGTDNFPTRYLLNDVAVLRAIPYVYGSIFRFEGQVSVFNYQGGPDYRDLFPEPPDSDLVPNCAEGGVLGVLPGIVGSFQALEAIKVITGIGEPLSGKLLTIDTLHNQYIAFKFAKREGRKKITGLIDYEQFCNPKSKQNIKVAQLSVLEFEKWEREGKEFQLIDVREPYEHDIVTIGGLLIPLSKIDSDLTLIAKDKPVVVYCRSGKRSEDAIRKLASLHPFENLYNLEGGLLKYAQEIDQNLVIY